MRSFGHSASRVRFETREHMHAVPGPGGAVVVVVVVVATRARAGVAAVAAVAGLFGRRRDVRRREAARRAG